MSRTSKPYARPDSGRRSNPDGPGSWKHDLHETVQSTLASRLSSSSQTSTRPSLLNRISGGQGRELLPPSNGSGKLFGFDAQPPKNLNNPNANVELLPSGTSSSKPTSPAGFGAIRTPRGFQAQPGARSLVQTGVNAALGLGEGRASAQRRELIPRREAREERMEGVSILGAGRTMVLVRVSNLAYGTTAEDVVSAFSPFPILTASRTSPSTAPSVTVDLEFQARSDAEEVVKKYDGAMADGNALSVVIVRPKLAERLSSSGAAAKSDVRSTAGAMGGRRGAELIPSSGSSKMYSDSILATNPTVAIQTLSDNTSSGTTRAQRADAWLIGGPPVASGLAGRLGARGRGQIGGGSYADMMVD